MGKILELVGGTLGKFVHGRVKGSAKAYVVLVVGILEAVLQFLGERGTLPPNIVSFWTMAIPIGGGVLVGTWTIEDAMAKLKSGVVTPPSTDPKP